MSSTAAAHDLAPKVELGSSIIQVSRAAAIMVSLLAFSPIGAADGNAGLARYQCVVLGERSGCTQSSPVHAEYEEQRIEPGPIARYLMKAGWNQDQAIANARATGEIPRRLRVRVIHNELTAFQKYDRLHGRTAPEGRTEIIISSTLEDGSEPEHRSRTVGMHGETR